MPICLVRFWPFKRESTSTSISFPTSSIPRGAELFFNCCKRLFSFKHTTQPMLPLYEACSDSAIGTPTHQTFASFGAHAGDDRTFEEAVPNTGNTSCGSSTVEPQADTSHPIAASPQPPSVLPTGPPKEPTQAHSQDPPERPSKILAKKILARPPSLNGPPRPDIPSELSESAINSEGHSHLDTEDAASMTSSVSMQSTESSGSETDSTSPERSEYVSEGTETEVLRPLRIPPWHYRSRRPNVRATRGANEGRPLYIASADDPMKFPF
ncbi:hypothetical protein GYMLUDRAFT_255349 [Collybiopsis luxurians FD-317 M1]|nr:hypothetical protein GYMLUDRAFT_255349 [Collybiopsis luxurians FD-317 M1]